MFQELTVFLAERGFSVVNGVAVRNLGPNDYHVLEDEGILIVERAFEGTDAEKEAVLNHVESLAGRYALTGAKIRGGKLQVFLTRPGEDTKEEATRIDYLTQSMERGIREIQGAKAAQDPVATASVPYRTAPVRSERRAEQPRQTVPQDPPRSRASYIPPEQNPQRAGSRTSGRMVTDRRFSYAGFFGAALGAVLGAILMAVFRTLSIPAWPVGFVIPLLTILIYRVMADHQMPIFLAIFMVLSTLLLGSVLITSIDIMAAGTTGILSVLRRGILAHLDNGNYYVSSVWLKFGLSALAAALPTVLLLLGGKKREIFD